MESAPTSSPSPSPLPPFTLQATTSLEIAIDILLSNSQPITIRNALAAYIRAADFSPEEASSGANTDDTVTVEDAIVAFEHALDKHPLPFQAMLEPSQLAAPSTKRKTTKTAKKSKKTKTKTFPPGLATAYLNNSPGQQPFSYHRPFINEVDKLRREYYTEKAENAFKAASAQACTCGKCGDSVIEAGGFAYDAYSGSVPLSVEYGHCVGYEIAVEYGVDMRWDIRARPDRGMTCGTDGCVACETFYFGQGEELSGELLHARLNRRVLTALCDFLFRCAEEDEACEAKGKKETSNKVSRRKPGPRSFWRIHKCSYSLVAYFRLPH